MKYIIALCFISFGLTACNTSTKEEKIDFTKSYESAALALTDAQLAYDAALLSNDTARISAAKQQLETAKTTYLNSKTYYTSHGGIVNKDYEQLLAKTNTSLGKPANDTTKVAISNTEVITPSGIENTPIAVATKKFIDSSRVNATKKVKQVSDAVVTGERTVKQVSDAVATGGTTVKKSVEAANENFTKVSDSAKKRIEELKKQGNDIRNLFKKKPDTIKNN
ncbi:hypothetical protein [Pedobacter sp. Leaf170]|uniref:hypothetical protein n=1 Tax=Pedobacter sp. Leaf170 TaxID=2876558 RepID=UPI001E439AC0|nr:hypothetical protein [Pedobacter sp. Leaf170]